MAFLNYEYSMKISYSKPVDKCYFTIKSFPVDDFRQRSIAFNITMEPSTQYSEGVDSFGNTQIIGSEDYPHSCFLYKIKGMVETQSMSITGGVNESLVGMYKYPHGKCIPGDALNAFFQEIQSEVDVISNTKEKCIKIMNLISEKMNYETGSTAVETTAEQAFSGGKGVCQDYAHIFITVLRLFKIPARYVCGLIIGEGQSHAWVEAVCDGNYIAFDPTHNCELTDEYIKLGSGRDATDCAINRGVMWGGGDQTQEINVTVEKYY